MIPIIIIVWSAHKKYEKSHQGLSSETLNAQENLWHRWHELFEMFPAFFELLQPTSMASRTTRQWNTKIQNQLLTHIGKKIKMISFRPIAAYLEGFFLFVRAKTLPSGRIDNGRTVNRKKIAPKNSIWGKMIKFRFSSIFCP